MSETINKKNRKKYLSIFLIILIIFFGGYCIWYYLIYGSKTISTENAYTKADVAQILPKINSPVQNINVIDTQYVNKGDILVILEDAEERIALQIASSKLEIVKRKINQLKSNDLEYNEKISLNKLKIETLKTTRDKAYIDLKKAKKDLNRYKKLLKTQSISQQIFDDIKLKYDITKKSWEESKLNLKSSIASKLVTQAEKKSNLELINDDKIENNPEILQVKANLRKAKLDLERTIIKAPISGVVTQKEVKLGQYVNTSTRLLTIVPIDKIYVYANFKETKLKKVKIGQKVELYSDLYGDDIMYTGVIQGFSSATGSSLSLIPAQNATGNWIKVVQRLPIRIKINENDLKKNPLYIGLSMHVKVYLDANRI